MPATPSKPARPSDEDLFRGDEPFALFGDWFEEAKAGEPNDPNGMALATVDADGLPDVRMVLLKGFDATGFVFYTNLESAKGQQLAANPQAALLFHWKSLRRQVRVRGPCRAGHRRRGRRLFRQPRRATARSAPGPRSRAGRWRAGSRWRSRAAELALKFGLGRVPRPPHWSGFRVAPLRHGVLARPARSACTTGWFSPARGRTRPGPARAFSRERFSRE